MATVSSVTPGASIELAARLLGRPCSVERPITVDQTNYSVVVDEAVVVKWLRPPVPVPHPGVELIRHLAAAGLRRDAGVPRRRRARRGGARDRHHLPARGAGRLGLVRRRRRALARRCSWTSTTSSTSAQPDGRDHCATAHCAGRLAAGDGRGRARRRSGHGRSALARSRLDGLEWLDERAGRRRAAAAARRRPGAGPPNSRRSSCRPVPASRRDDVDHRLRRQPPAGSRRASAAAVAAARCGIDGAIDRARRCRGREAPTTRPTARCRPRSARQRPAPRSTPTPRPSRRRRPAAGLPRRAGAPRVRLLDPPPAALALRRRRRPAAACSDSAGRFGSWIRQPSSPTSRPSRRHCWHCSTTCPRGPSCGAGPIVLSGMGSSWFAADVAAPAAAPPRHHRGCRTGIGRGDASTVAGSHRDRHHGLGSQRRNRRLLQAHAGTQHHDRAHQRRVGRRCPPTTRS